MMAVLQPKHWHFITVLMYICCVLDGNKQPLGYQIKKSVTGWACSTHGAEKKCLQRFVGEI